MVKIPAMPDFDAILFDFDGVLVDSEPMHCACWAEVLAPFGVTLEWDFYRREGIGIDDRDMLRILATQVDPPRDWETLWAEYPAKKQLFRTRMVDRPEFLPEIGQMLKRLHGTYKLAVVSSSSTDEIEPMLEAGGLRHYFDTVVGGNQVKRQKPAPEPYLLGAERLGARTALVIEDSDAGLEAGRAAGFEVLRVVHPRDVPALLLQRLGIAAL